MSRHNVVESLYAWVMIVAIISVFNIQYLINAFLIGIFLCLAYVPAYRLLGQTVQNVERQVLLRFVGIGFLMALVALCVLGDESRGNAMVATLLGYAAARPARMMVGNYLLAED
ncbi:hypothetical protein RRX38_03040 [Pseudomonas sp. DTU_2021_1001937_2_SI_NGA_ILE_001]|uniref:hypothetical protein n=1 Tax=Pseudomonas sp. DTU_2021_1001937_2_SI_NGA_ILE_001 TaxID=3077589 RepID=UPI0028FC2CBA|nr:hypothetical protein [Pseudomonas sp. DTU_2021_1001937_2_SI_NGA_ILE_001]WNW10166.1 hypothetical protein RRX38_03040 [Pseudomonas sp. DTU_2021_1001937_2_SI_NGA_ILE_001]